MFSFSCTPHLKALCLPLIEIFVSPQEFIIVAAALEGLLNFAVAALSSTLTPEAFVLTDWTLDPLD